MYYLKNKLKMKDMTQEQFTNRIGIAREYFSGIQSGKRGCSFLVAHSITAEHNCINETKYDVLELFKEKKKDGIN